ncbi:4Fe-4S binding protein, partial [bacterium]|nr:4Fe-4S binding protein [bacterium]
MKELVVISGKGGTGKTSVVASFASLPGRKVIADCDVDAADLHLVLSPSVVETHEFSGGVTAILDQKKCDGSGKCLEVCRFEAVSRTHVNGKWVYSIDSMACDGCGVCAYFCPSRAI